MKIKTVHIQALGLWVIYTIANKVAFFSGISHKILPAESYLINMIVSSAFGLLFLYLFSHEDFFKFARELENKNRKKTVKLEHYFIHTGKILTALIIGIISGALLSALIVRILLPRFKYRYVLVAVSSALSPIVSVTLLRLIVPRGLWF